MYKEYIISIVIIIAIVILNIFTQNYTKDCVSYVDNELEELRVSMMEDEKDQEEIQKKIDGIIKEWEERYQKLAYFIEHDELEKVETQLTALKANIEIEEYQQGIPELDVCIFILNHIKDKFSLQIKNIF